jgi:hypothetical protein
MTHSSQKHVAGVFLCIPPPGEQLSTTHSHVPATMCVTSAPIPTESFADAATTRIVSFTVLADASEDSQDHDIIRVLAQTARATYNREVGRLLLEGEDAGEVNKQTNRSLESTLSVEKKHVFRSSSDLAAALERDDEDSGVASYKGHGRDVCAQSVDRSLGGKGGIRPYVPKVRRCIE